MLTSDYSVTGMTCGHCELSIREEVGEIAGVAAIQVSAQTGILRVSGENPISEAEVLAAVAEAGYSAVRTA